MVFSLPHIYGFGVGLCLHCLALGLSKMGLDSVCSYGLGVGMLIFLPLDFDLISRDWGWGFSNNVFSFFGFMVVDGGINLFSIIVSILASYSVFNT